MSTEFTIKEQLRQYLPKTPAEVLVQGHDLPVAGTDEYDFVAFGNDSFQILVGDYEAIHSYLQQFFGNISYYSILSHGRNTRLSLKDLVGVNAFIDPGAIVCDGASIGEHAHIMMGAVINTGTQIGENSIIEMGSVVGQGSVINKNCHIGANSVLASMTDAPIVIDDNAKIGPNVTILSGVHVGKNAIIAAGSVVSGNVPPNAIFAGSPARRVLSTDDKSMALHSVTSQK